MNSTLRTISGALAGLSVATMAVLPSTALAHNTSVATDVQAALNWTDGTRGALVRRIGGPTIYTQNAGFQFEPASAIKFLHALHAERQIQNGSAVTTQSVAVPTQANGSCPLEGATTNQTLEWAIEKMMEDSSNAHTEAIKDEFGQAAINQTAWSLGANNSLLQHKVGCGNPQLPNKLTLNDIGLLYEKAFTDDQVLTPARRQHLWDRMNRSHQSLLNTAKDEAMAHWGVDAPAGFYDKLKIAYKPGRYTYCTNADCSTNTVHRAIAGYVEIPVRVTLFNVPIVVSRKYVFGVFISGAKTDPGDLFTAEYTSGLAQNNAVSALFRTELKNALDTWL